MFALLPAIDVYPQQVERLLGRTLASMGSVHGEHDLLIDQPVLRGHGGHAPGSRSPACT